MMEISSQEKYIIETMRELRPFEVIEIQKDKLGRPGTYFIKRTQKIIVTELEITAVKG